MYTSEKVYCCEDVHFRSRYKKDLKDHRSLYIEGEDIINVMRESGLLTSTRNSKLESEDGCKRVVQCRRGPVRPMDEMV